MNNFARFAAAVGLGVLGAAGWADEPAPPAAPPGQSPTAVPT